MKWWQSLEEIKSLKTLELLQNKQTNKTLRMAMYQKKYAKSWSTESKQVKEISLKSLFCYCQGEN